MPFNRKTYEGTDRLAHIEKYVDKSGYYPLAQFTGLINCNNPPNVYTGVGGSPSTQTIYGSAMYLAAGESISNINLLVSTVGSGTAPTNFFVGLATYTTMLAISTDLAASSSLTTLGIQSFPLAAPFTIPSSGMYLACFWKNGTFGTTDVAVARNSITSGTPVNADGTFFSPAKTGQATFPAVNAALTWSFNTLSAWAGVS